MSSGKRFEKTFSRKKKEETNTSNKNNKSNNNVKKKTTDEDEDEEHLLISQLKSSSSSPKNMKKTGPTTAQKVNNNNNNNKNKKERDGLKQNVHNDGKDESLMNQKRKAENGVVKKEKNPNMAAKMKKPKKVKEREKEETSECAFPMNRIMRIVKSEGTSDSKISGEAVFLINKAAEKFIELFSKDAYDSAVEDRKSFVGYKHLASAVCKKKRLDFLSDFVPEKVAAEKALAERKPAEILPS